MDGLGREERCAQMMTRMYDLTKDDIFCDLVLEVKNEKFNVHKCVLAAASKKLREMIVQDIQKNDPMTFRMTPTLELQNITANGARLLLDYIYCGKEPDPSEPSGLKDFREACCVLEVPQPKLLGDAEAEPCKSSSTNDSTDNDEQNVTIEVTTNSSADQNISGETLGILSVKKPRKNIKTERDENSDFVVSSLSDAATESPQFHNYNFDELATLEFIEVTEDGETVKNKSDLIVQIVNDDEDDDEELAESDNEYILESDDDNNPGEMKLEAGNQCRDRENAEDDERPEKRELETGKRCRGKENTDSSPKTKKIRNFGGRPSRVVKEELVIVQGLDISSLFTTKKRNNLPPPVPDPSLALKRGRPRLANDHIFPNQPPYVCPYMKCTKVCDTREKLKKHYRNHDERTHSCQQCGKKFLYNKDLVTHLRTHTGERPFRCEQCGSNFAQKATLQYHMKMHDDARMEFFCEECGQHYKTFKGLERHVEKKHCDSEKKIFMPEVAVMQNPVPCPVCSKRFHNYQSVYLHLRRQHPESEEAKGILQNRKGRKPRFGKKIARVEEKARARQQTDDDPTTKTDSLSCDACGETFEEQEIYMEHLETCEMIAKCQYCELIFETEELRDEHIESTHKAYDVNSETVEVNVTTSSIDNVVTTESMEGVTILNLENMFEKYTS